jgi:hypothetical protein
MEHLTPAQRADALARFEAKFIPEPNSGCWLWTGGTSGYGYGHFSLPVRGCRTAHRAAWTLYRGQIPAGLHVLHKCDVRCCVNPSHLFLGTHSDNMRDMVRKGRWSKGKRGPAIRRAAWLAIQAPTPPEKRT